MTDIIELYPIATLDNKENIVRTNRTFAVRKQDILCVVLNPMIICVQIICTYHKDDYPGILVYAESTEELQKIYNDIIRRWAE